MRPSRAGAPRGRRLEHSPLRLGELRTRLCRLEHLFELLRPAKDIPRRHAPARLLAALHGAAAGTGARGIARARSEAGVVRVVLQ